MNETDVHIKLRPISSECSGFWYEEEATSLLSNGSLMIQYPDGIDLIDQGSYCLNVRAQNQSFFVCEGAISERFDESYCEKIRQEVFNFGTVISIVFTSITLVIYLCTEVAGRSVYGSLCKMYLFNLLAKDIVLAIDRLSNITREDGLQCIVLGYVRQYLSLSFYFALHSLGLFSFFLVCSSRIEKLKLTLADPSNKNFVRRNVYYVQGAPLLIVVITICVDSVRKHLERMSPASWKGGDVISFPEMGVYDCYMSYQKTDPRPSYFVTPEFIYVQLFHTLIIISNLVLFCITCRDYMNLANFENSGR